MSPFKGRKWLITFNTEFFKGRWGVPGVVFTCTETHECMLHLVSPNPETKPFWVNLSMINSMQEYYQFEDGENVSQSL